MPELPEVECLAGYLRGQIIGLKIKKFISLSSRIIARQSIALKRLTNCQIVDVGRRGKYIILKLVSPNKLTNGELLIHLRMSGRLELCSSRKFFSKYHRFVIRFTSGRDLRLHDVRKFAKVAIVKSAEEVTAKLGVEPLSGDFKPALLSNLLSSSSKKIKTFLLDQSKIAGVGNIYADESLWRARINPLKKANLITADEARSLWEAIKSVLKKAIKNNGTDNGDRVVLDGLYQPAVYGRGGMPCGRCRKPIRRVVINQRSAHYCEYCQR
ncbi:MAG TPA: DNA-formamidopyrimidine glycosylase [Oligoflexia bacterium]|nr:DNA-formamidopyrimidine glycosylase [Oligoflexia bacterium]HMP27644.1 DNA-formamidopyrimidine glycosylase [Oligoflexia bacterium]